MSKPGPVEEAVGEVVIALGNLQHVAGQRSDTGGDALRRRFQDRLFALRERLTPSGDPVYVQIGSHRRAYQVLVLAGEFWIFRGFPRAGAEFDLLAAAARAAAMIAEEKV